MKKLNQVIVTVEEERCISGLDYEVRRAIDEYIYKQHEHSLELFK